jgi:hippurate hydrolase
MTGAGGHTSDAGNGADVLAAAAEAVTAIKAFAKKTILEKDKAGVTVCTFYTDTDAPNILAETVYFNGSIRTFDGALHQTLKEGVQKIVAEIAAKHGVDLTFEFKNPYPMLENSKTETDFAAGVAKDLLGDANVVTQVPPILATEDFAEFLRERPGNFIALGTGNPKTKDNPGLHTAKYDFNDAALPIGASYWVKLVEKALPLYKPAAPAQDIRPPQP